MSVYLEGFWLGNAAILGNVCVLPLYPGLFVFVAGTATTGERAKRTFRLAGVAVFSGVVSALVAIGFVLHLLNRAAAEVLDYVLPLAYGGVLALGVATVLGRNPLVRVGSLRAPVVRSPVVSAYLYGVLLAPLTLPCTGPLVISAFVVGGVNGTGALADSLAYALSFALGFGWPLLVLPLLALPVQRVATSWLVRHHRTVGVVSGVLLIGVALLGFWNDVLPTLR